MSDHDAHIPSREEVVAIITRPIPKRLGTLSLILAIVGFAIFLIGVFTGNPRAWQAYHVNWLFFTTFSSAAVAFRTAHNDGALVATDDPVHGRLRRVAPHRVRAPAVHDHRR